MTKKTLLPFLFFFIISICQTTAQPNFVVIISDDMGWTGSSTQMAEDLPESKSDYYLTSEIELMAQAGMTFSQGYAPAPKCSPSRCSILTGRTTARNQFTNTGNGIATDKLLIEPTIDNSLNGTDTTLVEWLKSTNLNYRTAHYGKWHLGGGTSSPANNGFDFSDGNTSNGDGNQGGTAQEDPKKIFDLTDRSIDFVQGAVTDGVPFYLQLSHYAVHGDVEAKQETIDLYNDPTQRPPGIIHTDPEYAAMTENTDDGIGQLLEEITSLGIDNNTYVIFMSDNGGPTNLTDNTPLFRGKTFLYEGGIRVPFIIKGPNVTPSAYSTEAIIAYDLFPTIAELTGSSADLPADLDGQSLVPLWSNGSFNRNEPLYFHSPHYENNPNKTPRSALVDGNYKLIVEYETGNTYLYDLSTDIGESNDLSTTQPDQTLDLCVKLRDHLKDADAPMPTLDPVHPNFSGTAPDIDADGLDDDWEFRELLSYTYGPDDDPDGDGISNLEEFTDGTDPYLNETILALNGDAFFAGETTFDAKVKLYWFAMDNGIVDFIEIERSSNAYDWYRIGKVEGGVSNYLDTKPIEGLSYYRLKVANEIGEVDYSYIISIDLDKESLIRIYPNPTFDELHIQFEKLSSLPSEIQLRIFDVNGKEVKRFKKNKTMLITLPLNDLPAGFYFVQVYTDSSFSGNPTFSFTVE